MQIERGNLLVRFAVDHPRTVIFLTLAITLLAASVAVVPSIWPDKFNFLNAVAVDTDPENMLAGDEAVRVFHDRMKKEFSLHDMVVVGVVNDEHPDGVFNPESLRRIYDLTQYAKTLTWPDPDNPGKQNGVIEVDLLAPSTVDNIEQGGVGAVNFSWLMPKPPANSQEALAVRDRALRIPFLNGTLVSEDGKAIALYLPLTDKDFSYRVRKKLLEKVASSPASDDQFHITGLPVAEDTFGVEMFYQMAVSAPLAMLVIFISMWLFFHKVLLTVPSIVLALVCTTVTMSLLVISGHTIHIMSSMIPIFIIPIQVLDDIHVISEFFDRYKHSGDRRETVLEVLDTLFLPLLFTSLTTVAGFASLALTPIPPVQVFGVFIAIGVMVAWLTTVTFIPAAIMLIPEKQLESIGRKPDAHRGDANILARSLIAMGQFAVRRAKVILATVVACVLIAGYGLSLIQINDNPTKWFARSHPIRVADRVLNEHFGGTYMAYLALEPGRHEQPMADYVYDLIERLNQRKAAALGAGIEAMDVFDMLRAEIVGRAASATSKAVLLDALNGTISVQMDSASDKGFPAWDDLQLFVEQERQRDEIFKQPEVLRYMSELQTHLKTTGIVGKSNSLADIVKTVHRELLLGEEKQFRIPDTSNAVAQTLITFQNGHRPGDLWHLVTPDYRKTSLWLQLTSGDNRDMSKVVRAVDDFIANHPPPLNLSHRWFGLTYINVIWQDRMVSGMVQAFLGSFLVVLLMMILLFRSALWGLLSMIPLTITVGLIYGIIGFIGKDYDMPVAVLSSLSLGLAVDYAIHFLARSRMAVTEKGSWQAAVIPVFGEPARAITRNAIVVGAGFLPLLAATLIPYQTVGVFIAAILLMAGLASLFILPALITLFERWLFPQTRLVRLTCNCGTCVIAGVTFVALVGINLHQFFHAGWTTLSTFSLAAVVMLAAICAIMARRQACRTVTQ